MTANTDNPLDMIPDPYSGDSYVYSKTLCSEQRRVWMRRANEIIAFLMTSEFALKDSYDKHLPILLEGKKKKDTPIKIESSDGRSIVMPLHAFVRQFSDSVEVLCRQVFVMFYGSLETYLFELIERSFPEIGITDDILDRSLDIMMRKKWDGKFCKMSDVFSLDYKATSLIDHFKGFEMNFEGKTYNNPLSFLDDLAQIRHRIVHASSVLKKGKLIFVNAQVFHAYYAFCALLTDYIDALFSNKFGYDRKIIYPAAT